MDDAATGQVNRTAADIYEAFFVPALFQEWAPRVTTAAQLKAGDSVLDVACGTGVLTRETARRVGMGGRTVGLDRNDGMLAVARRAPDVIEWRTGVAETLPFETGEFDAVVSQFGLMFFEDRAQALREMWRVLKPSGHLAVAVWGPIGGAPGYADMVALLRRLFGEGAAQALSAPYALGDRDVLRDLFVDADIPGVQIETIAGTAQFPSIDAWVHTDIKGWTLADMIDDAQYEELRQAAQTALAGYARDDGTVQFPHPAHIVTVAKA